MFKDKKVVVTGWHGFVGSHVGVKRVVLSSSSAVYVNQEEMPLVETVPSQPLSPYAV